MERSHLTVQQRSALRVLVRSRSHLLLLYTIIIGDYGRNIAWYLIKPDAKVLQPLQCLSRGWRRVRVALGLLRSMWGHYPTQLSYITRSVSLRRSCCSGGVQSNSCARSVSNGGKVEELEDKSDPTDVVSPERRGGSRHKRFVSISLYTQTGECRTSCCHWRLITC